MPNAPCRGCTERQLGCHGICKIYIDWKTEHDIARESEHLKNSSYQPSGNITLGDVRLSYKHFNASKNHSKHKQKKY